jgi:hypothetical protein
LETSALANRTDIETDLTLEIDGNFITPEKFLRGVRSFFAIVTEVTAKIGGRKTAIRWRVQVKKGSNLIGISPQPGFDPAVISLITDAVGSGIDEIERMNSEPQYFSERALKSVRELGSLIGKPDKDETTVRLWVRKEPHPVTANSVAAVNSLLTSEHEDYGSIEGRLQTVTERGGLQFVVYEPLWDRGIRCYIPETLTDEAIASFGLRVEVYGLIKYRKDGTPMSIEADEIVRLTHNKKIPSFSDVRGILRGRQ